MISIIRNQSKSENCKQKKTTKKYLKKCEIVNKIFFEYMQLRKSEFIPSKEVLVSIPAPNGSVDRHYVGIRISNYCECEVYNSDKGDVPLL